mgnify:FL=1
MKDDKPVFAGTNKRGTRKGVKANHPSTKLVNITNGEEIKRLPRNIAEPLIALGWKYCPKKFKLDKKGE